MGKKLIIYNSVDYFVPYIQKEGVDVFQIYRKIPFLLKIIRKIIFKFNLPFKRIWFSEWIDRMDNYSEIIFFSTSPIQGLEFIRKKYPNIKIIFWYWNPVKISLHPDNVLKLGATPWAFDKADSIKYAINHNSTFYFKDLKLEEHEIDNDFLFVGLDKGRRAILEKLESDLKRKSLRTNFYIVDSNASSKNYTGNFPYISYSEYLIKLSKSRVIVDIMQEGQTGLTLRPMESIFFNKKIITDNLSIENADFYRPENVFILGKDDIDNIEEFINSPYRNIDHDILDSYDFKNWMSRFSLK